MHPSLSRGGLGERDPSGSANLVHAPAHATQALSPEYTTSPAPGGTPGHSVPAAGRRRSGVRGRGRGRRDAGGARRFRAQWVVTTSRHRLHDTASQQRTRGSPDGASAEGEPGAADAAGRRRRTRRRGGDCAAAAVGVRLRRRGPARQPPPTLRGIRGAPQGGGAAARARRAAQQTRATTSGSRPRTTPRSAVTRMRSWLFCAPEPTPTPATWTARSCCTWRRTGGAWPGARTFVARARTDQRAFAPDAPDETSDAGVTRAAAGAAKRRGPPLVVARERARAGARRWSRRRTGRGAGACASGAASRRRRDGMTARCGRRGPRGGGAGCWKPARRTPARGYLTGLSRGKTAEALRAPLAYGPRGGEALNGGHLSAREAERRSTGDRSRRHVFVLSIKTRRFLPPSPRRKLPSDENLARRTPFRGRPWGGASPALAQQVRQAQAAEAVEQELRRPRARAAPPRDRRLLRVGRPSVLEEWRALGEGAAEGGGRGGGGDLVRGGGAGAGANRPSTAEVRASWRVPTRVTEEASEAAEAAKAARRGPSPA